MIYLRQNPTGTTTLKRVALNNYKARSRRDTTLFEDLVGIALELAVHAEAMARIAEVLGPDKMPPGWLVLPTSELSGKSIGTIAEELQEEAELVPAVWSYVLSGRKLSSTVSVMYSESQLTDAPERADVWNEVTLNMKGLKDPRGQLKIEDPTYGGIGKEWGHPEPDEDIELDDLDLED